MSDLQRFTEHPDCYTILTKATINGRSYSRADKIDPAMMAEPEAVDVLTKSMVYRLATEAGADVDQVTDVKQRVIPPSTRG